ncbi:MAG: hypothetical protein MI755_03365 [Sphingomonadales bacterium]|nr:hypothetical protein [Sphingomonadales bacterium]
MIKKVVIAVIVLVIAVGLGAFLYFDSIVKSGIEVVGSRVLGTSITVDSVSMSPLNGSGSIDGLTVANVDGYNSDYAFQLGSLAVNVNASTVLSDVVEIQSVHIVQPRINYETRIVEDNIRDLINSLPAGDGGTEATGEAAGARVIIRELILEEPQLNLVAANLSAPIPLPDIRLENIGEENNSASVADALRIVLGEVSRSILNSNALDNLGEAAEQGLQGVENAVEDAVEEVGSRLRDIFN